MRDAERVKEGEGEIHRERGEREERQRETEKSEGRDNRGWRVRERGWEALPGVESIIIRNARDSKKGVRIFLSAQQTLTKNGMNLFS